MSARWSAAYAALGWRMMPCWPGTKRGILNHQEASSDMQAVEAALERWLDDHPGKTLPPIDRFNWAVAAGPGSGIVVLDVENTDGERKLVELEREHGALPDLFPMVWSGRWHRMAWLFPPARKCPNSGPSKPQSRRARDQGRQAALHAAPERTS